MVGRGSRRAHFSFEPLSIESGFLFAANYYRLLITNVRTVDIRTRGLLVIISFASGAIFSYFTIAYPAQRARDDLQMFQLESTLVTLGLIRENNSVELLRRKEKQLPTFARMLGHDLKDHPGAEVFLWKIRQYYRTNALPIDTALQNYFEGLPHQKPTPERLYYYRE